MINYLTFNWIGLSEYFPINFRCGIQIPLYKEKITPICDQNNCRAITLLGAFNKAFEIVIRSRLEKWWTENDVIAESQGACHEGPLLIHTAILLQETIASH